MATSENTRPSEVSVKSSDSLVEPSTHSAQKRLQKELMSLMMANDKNISAFPDGDNLFRWVATILGPPETVFHGLKFKLSLSFSSKYPYSAPHVTFLTKCFHPNINSEGEICLDILKDKWTALYDVRTILLSIQSLLAEPNLESPLDSHASSVWGQQAYRELMMVQYNKSTSNAK